jgi:DnaK suppressor protein
MRADLARVDMMDPMSDLTEQQQSQLAALLQQRADELLANARGGLEMSMSRERTGGRDSLDESTEEELLSTELRLRDREKKLLQKVHEAQNRLREGEINECEDCGEPIGFKRLMARPMTTLCIACKEVREEQEAASGDAPPRRAPSADRD